MVILGRVLAWLGFIVAAGLLVMAGFRFYQGITGHYARAEALGDPLGSAIVYMMWAAVTWLVGMMAGHFLGDDTE